MTSSAASRLLFPESLRARAPTSYNIKSKIGKFYTAQYPILRIAKTTSQFIPWQTCSIERHLNQLLWEASSHSAINVQRLYVQIFTTVYSQVFIHMAE